MFLTKNIQDQKNMPQIIIQERTAHLASYTFLEEMLLFITRHVHSFSTTKSTFFTKNLSLATFIL